MRWRRRLKSYTSQHQTLFLETLPRNRLTFSASTFRRATNQPAIPNQKDYAKWKETLLLPAQRFGERQAILSKPGTIDPIALHFRPMEFAEAGHFDSPLCPALAQRNRTYQGYQDAQRAAQATHFRESKCSECNKEPWRGDFLFQGGERGHCMTGLVSWSMFLAGMRH